MDERLDEEIALKERALKAWSKALEEIEQLKKKREWISVDDRLPEEKREVLTFSIEYGHIFRDLACIIDGEWSVTAITRELSPTHWMPLPEDPKD